MDGVRLPLPVPDIRRDKLGEKRSELPGGNAGGRMVPWNDDVAAQEERLRQEIGAACATSDYLHGRVAGDYRQRRKVESGNGRRAGVRPLQRGDLRGGAEGRGVERGGVQRQRVEERDGCGGAESQASGAGRAR